MPLELQAWEDRDFEVYPELAWRAFKDDLMGVLYPNGYSEADRAKTTRDSRRKHHKRGDMSKWMKVVDSDLPSDEPLHQIVGLSHWHFYIHERSKAELDTEEEDEDKEEPSPGLHREFAENFFGDIEKIRRETLGGRPYVLLHILLVRPEYHRRGIGGMQLSWGSEQADRLGLPMYLESSPMGRPLYERHGYEKVADLWCDAKAYGHEKDLPHVCMLRPAKTESKEAS